MAIRQGHHIRYQEDIEDGGWVVDVNALQHKTITAIQRTIATDQSYADLTNFVHSVVEEWNRQRHDLDTGQDTRISRMKGKKAKS